MATIYLQILLDMVTIVTMFCLFYLAIEKVSVDLVENLNLSLSPLPFLLKFVPDLKEENFLKH